MREGIETQYIQNKSAGSILWNEQGKRINYLRFNLQYNGFQKVRIRLLLKSLSSCYDVLHGDAVHGKESLVRSGLAELILDANSLYFALAGLCYYFADSASKAVENVVVLDGDDLADLLDAVIDAVNIERLYSVHIDNARVDALLSQLLGCCDSKAYCVTVSDDGDILAVLYHVRLADLERRSVIIDHRDGVSCKAKINRSVICCSSCYQLPCGIVVSGHDHSHVRDRAKDAQVLYALVGSAVVSRCKSAVGSGDLDIQLRIADLLTDHLEHSLGTENCISYYERNLAAGGHTGCNACAVLLSDTYVVILSGKGFSESLCLTGLTDIDIYNTNILIGFSKLNDLISKTFSGRF